MQLPAPARECSESELDAVYQFHARRATPPLEPMPFTPAWYTAAQAAHAAMDYDDEPGPAQDLTSMGMLVMAGCTAVGVVGLIALAMVVL